MDGRSKWEWEWERGWKRAEGDGEGEVATRACLLRGVKKSQREEAQAQPLSL